MYYELSSVAARQETAKECECLIAYWCMREDFGVCRPPPRMRAETESRHPFAFSVDLLLFAGDQANRRQLKIEVKGKNESFTTPETWPFDDVFLFNANKESRPDAVVLYSMITRHVLVVMRDEATWFKGEAQDKAPDRNGLQYPVVKAPVTSLLTWDQFVPAAWKLLGQEGRASKIFPRLNLPPLTPEIPKPPESLTENDLKELLS